MLLLHLFAKCAELLVKLCFLCWNKSTAPTVRWPKCDIIKLISRNFHWPITQLLLLRHLAFSYFIHENKSLNILIYQYFKISVKFILNEIFHYFFHKGVCLPCGSIETNFVEMILLMLKYFHPGRCIWNLYLRMSTAVCQWGNELITSNSICIMVWHFRSRSHGIIATPLFG